MGVIPNNNKPNCGGIHAFLLLPLFLLLSCGDNPSKTGTGSMDWKIFRGNVSLNGFTETPLPANPVLKWSYKGETRTASSPVVAGGTTYWCDKRGYIRGVDTHGEMVFEYDLKTAVEATPMLHDSILYIGRIDGFMTAISLAKRDTLWNYETEGQITASPNHMQFEGRDAVVFGSYDNFLYCLDAQNGSELAKFESGYYINGAAALWEEHLIFGGCDAWVRIIDYAQGTATDSLDLEAYVPASPAIMGNDCFIGDYSGNMYWLKLADGKIVHHQKITQEENENGSFVAVPAISKECCYFYSGNRHLLAINRNDGTLRWKYMLKGNTGESSPVVCNDKIIACTKTGVISILDASNGKLIWEFDTGEQITASPAVIKEHFMVLTTKGTLFCFWEESA